MNRIIPYAPYILAVGAFGAIMLAARKAVPAEPKLPEWRQRLIDCARAHVEKKTPYQWGGGRSTKDWGLDCSGLFIHCARTVPFDFSGWHSHRMWNELPRVLEPEPGDAAFYLKRHVVMVESFDKKTGTATIIGANGGDSTSTSAARAAEQKAFVRREPTHLYRDGFQGFVTLKPLVER
jgi:hypothetical protein